MPVPLANNLLKYSTAFGRVIIVIINNVYCIPTYVVWMTMLIPLKCIHRETYYKIEGLFFHWLLSIVAMWSYSAGYDIVEVGDDISECRDKKTLVIANHQSTADVPLLMANFNTKDNVLPNVMWIMDKLFKYTNFGIVSIIHQDFFISSGRKHREETLIDLKRHIKDSFLQLNRKWMVLFPEGGFLRKRREISKRFAEKNNLPILENVTLPRIGALKTIMESMCKLSIDNTTVTEVTKISKENTDDDNKKNNLTRRTAVNTTLSKEISNKENEKSGIEERPSTITNGENKEEKHNSNYNKTTNSTSVNKSTLESKSSVNNTSETVVMAAKSEKELLESTKEKDTDHSKSYSQQNGDLEYKNLKNNSENTNKTTSECLLDYILDITIAYPNGEPIGLPSIIHGLRDSCKTYMLYRLYKISEIPKEEGALTQWLYDRFVEKNTLLENFYKFGEFYSDRTLNATILQQDVLRFLLINLFFITSTYFHYQMFCALYAYGGVVLTSDAS